MQRLEVSGAVRPLYGSLGVKGLTPHCMCKSPCLRKHVAGFQTFIYRYSLFDGGANDFIVMVRQQEDSPQNRSFHNIWTPVSANTEYYCFKNKIS